MPIAEKFAVYGSGGALAPPHVGLEHSPVGRAHPSSTIQTHIMPEAVGDIVLLLVQVSDLVKVSILTFNPRFLPSLPGRGIVRFVHLRFGSMLFVAQVFRRTLDPLPGVEHVIVNAHNEQFDSVVFLDDFLVCRVLFQTCFRQDIGSVVALPLGFRIALIRGVFESGKMGFHPGNGADFGAVVPDEGP